MSDESDRRDDEDRRAILARRRRFVTIALASAGVGAVGCDRQSPEPCLSPIPEPTQTVESTPTVDTSPGGAAPMPCLSPPMPPPPDAGTASGDEAQDTPDAGGAPEPLPTTKPKPPIPRVCLRIAPPPDWDKK